MVLKSFAVPERSNILRLSKIPLRGEDECLVPCWNAALNPEGDNKAFKLGKICR